MLLPPTRGIKPLPCLSVDQPGSDAAGTGAHPVGITAPLLVPRKGQGCKCGRLCLANSIRHKACIAIGQMSDVPIEMLTNAKGRFK